MFSQPGIWKKALYELSDPKSAELTVVGPKDFFVTRSGKRIKLDIELPSDEAYHESIVKELVPMTKSSLPFETAYGLYEGRLTARFNGNTFTGRCHIVTPPATDVEQVTITKRSTSLSTLETIAKSGSMSEEMLNFIRASIKAGLTIALSGSTGSGKDLHKDTLIPTEKGFKSLGEIEIGDIVYDEAFRKTAVLNKYQPFDPEHYLLKFGNREEVKAGQGHLWKVYDLNEKTFSARFLLDVDTTTKLRKALLHDLQDSYVTAEQVDEFFAQNLITLNDTHKKDIEGFFAYNETANLREIVAHILQRHFTTILSPYTYFVKLMTTEQIFSSGKSLAVIQCLESEDYTKPVEYVQIESIEKIDDNSADYYCLKVDSPLHTFLFGEKYMVTHNTTMMEALTKEWPEDLRVGVVEDVPELVLTQKNVSYLKSTPARPGVDEKDLVSLSWCVQQIQRMRTDRVLIGEVRGKELADFLIAANSGMEGSMITLHANNPAECLKKMNDFMFMTGQNRPQRSINASIAKTIDIVIQLVKDNGRYRTSHIQEVTPVLGNTEEALIATAELYAWDRTTDKFKKSGTITDNLRDKFLNKGIDPAQFTGPVGEMQTAYTGIAQNQVMLPNQPPKKTAGLPTGLPKMPIATGKRVL